MRDVTEENENNSRGIGEISRQAASLCSLQQEYDNAESAVGEIWERMFILTDLLESAGQPFVAVYPHGGILVCNRSFCELTGYVEEELKNMGWWDFTPTEWYSRAKSFLNDIGYSGISRRFEMEHVHKSGLMIPVEVFAYPVYAGKKVSCYVLFVSDITLRSHPGERQQPAAGAGPGESAPEEGLPGPAPEYGTAGLAGTHCHPSVDNAGQEEAARLDRLKFVGDMAAGMSHELRNPMTTVKGFLQMFLDKHEFQQYSEYFKIMLKEMDRANLIISNTLSLDKNRFIDLKLQNLNHIVESLSPLILTEAVQKNNLFEMELGNIPSMMLDKKEIRRLILNLVYNGLEAMSAGGCLMVKTYSAKREVVLSVQDQGASIPPDVLDKMGIPFFSTKENGTGLGLAMCYNIADRHNASIKVESGPRGTSVKVIFNL